MKKQRRPRIGIALGSGSSRGWAHIGIIQALGGMGIEPEIVCGCSVGAVVGAAYAAGNLARFEEWVRSLNRAGLARFIDVNLSLNGFIDQPRLQRFFDKYVCPGETRFRDLDKTFATVSTDLVTGKEVWFTDEKVLEAVWASMGLPGLFPPIQYRGRWLVDGGLVNPVPVSLCRALGADIVIAVNLNGDVVGKHFVRRESEEDDDLDDEEGMFASFRRTVSAYSQSLFGPPDNTEEPPGLFEAISGSINITQDRITRSRLAGDPPDILLSPKLAHIALMEFYRADEAIAEGRACVERLRPEIEHVLRNALIR